MHKIRPKRFEIEGTAKLTGIATIERTKYANEIYPFPLP